MVMNLLEVNPDARWTRVSVGEGKHSIVLADDFYRHPEALCELTQRLYYYAGPIHGNFPGARAVVSLHTRPVIQALSEAWGKPLVEASGFYQPAVFSVLSHSGKLQLSESQRQPHVDPGVSAMVYLNEPEECSGGTGVYRHRATGIEQIPPAPTPEIVELAKQHGIVPQSLNTPEGYTAFQDKVLFDPANSAPGNEYINDGNEAWELLYLIEMKFNRMVIFDGRMPHSQHIELGKFADFYRLNQILYMREEQGARP